VADIATLTVRINAATGELVAELKSMQTAAQAVTGGLTRMGVAAGEMLGKLGSEVIGKAVGYIQQFVADTIKLGDELGNLSAKLDVGTDALQEWGFAAKTSGSSLEEISQAAGEFGRRFAEGGDAMRAALSGIGLSFDELLAMSPEQRFEAVARALGTIEDPARATAAGVDLMGKSVSGLLPAFQNFDTLTAKARELGVVISGETLQAAGEFGNQMDILKMQGMAMVAEFMKPLLPIIVELAKAFSDIARNVMPVVRDEIVAFVTWLTRLDLEWLKMIRTIREAATQIPLLGKVFGLSATGAAALNAEIKKAEDELARLTTTAPPAAAATDGVGDAAKNAGMVAGLSSEEFKRLNQEYEEGQKKAKAYQAELDKLTGRDVVQGAAELVKQIRDAGGVSALTAAKVKTVGDELGKAIVIADAKGYVIPDVMRQTAFEAGVAASAIEAKTRPALLGLVDTAHLVVDGVADALAGLKNIPVDEYLSGKIISGQISGGLIDVSEIVGDPVSAAQQEAREKAEKNAKATWAGYGEKYSGAIIDAFKGGGDVGKTLGATIASDVFKGDAIKSAIGKGAGAVGNLVGKALGPTIGKGLGTALGSAIPVVGTLLGGLAGDFVGKLFGGGEGAKVNDMRDQFVAAAGGLDALNKHAAQAGLTLDRLLKAKTVKDYEAAVKQLETAFGKVGTQIANLSSVTGVLGRDGVAGLSKLQLGTEQASQAFAFFQQQTQKAAGGITTFLTNATVSSQASADAMTASLGALYEDLRLQGATATEAITALGPAILALNDQLGTTGFAGSEAFVLLRDEAALAGDEVAGPLYTAIGGLGDLMEGLANSGRLNQDIFSGLTSQVTATYGELEKMGKGGAAGLRLIQPELQDIYELQKDVGYSVDDSTQALLTLAQESGLVGEQFRSDQDKMGKAIEQLVARMGDLVKVLEQSLPKAADAAAGGIQAALNGIKAPTIRVPVVYDVEGAPPTFSTPGDVAGAATSPPPVIVEIDGREVAEASTRYSGAVLEPYGAG
jgi:hypothetical protein